MATPGTTHRISTVGVIGLGTMGVGIAEVFARGGYRVVAVEADEHTLVRGRARVEASIARAVERGKLSPDDASALTSRLTFEVGMAGLGEADLVIEAVPERLELKKQIFTALDDITRPETILATNTSSLPLTDIAVATRNPRRVVGMHFFNPAPVQRLVEVIRTVAIDPQVVDTVVEVARGLGKTVVVAGDRAGFVANGLLFGYLNQAVKMLEERYATREDVDAAMRLGCGLPMGPLALMDLIGLDTAYEILDTMYKQGRDRLHAPVPLLKQMVTAGLLGRKSGRGFYTYAAAGSAAVVPDAATPPAVAADPQALPQDPQALPPALVGVVGSGTMATGIVEVIARAGIDVVQVARSQASLERASARLTASLDKAVTRGKLTEQQRDDALARVSGSTETSALAQADLVVEAVVEDLAVKTALFAELGQVCRPDGVLATTTSSLPVIECAVATGRPQQVVGLHFFNPAPVMALVEVVHTVASSSQAVATALELTKRVGKHAVVCGDRAGFVVNALLFPYLNSAVRMLAEHYATADDIDLAMKHGCGYPMGPFELLDVVGLDVSLAIERTLYLEFREQGLAPAPLLEQLVTAGYLGRKVGRGFRTYP